MNKIPVAVYARFSSHNQREESIDQQLRICRRYAEEHDMQVVREYTDSAISGKTDKRPGFQKMIYESDKKQWKTLLVYSHDRFARNRYDAATYKAKLKKNGINVIAVTLPLEDSPESVLIESMMEGYAEYYSVNLSRNVKRGMEENALSCKSNGSPPLGYAIKDGKYVLDPVGSRAVKLIFDMYDAGKRKADIVRELNKCGYKTRLGKPFSHNSLWRILINEKYTGVYIYDGTRIEGGMPVIIQRDQWERVQDKIQRRKQSRGRSKAVEEYILSGKLFCGECGQPMIGESGKSKSGEIYRYYKCSTKKRKGADKCSKHTERKEELEEAVIAYICQSVLTDENIKLIAQRCFQLLDEESQDKSLLAKLEVDHKDVSQKIENILSAIEQGIFTPKTKERLEALEIELQDLEGRIVSEKLKKPEFTQDHIEFWLQSFKAGNIRDEEQSKAIVDALLNSVFIFDKKEGSDKKIVIALNLKNTPVATLKCSDLLHLVDQCAYSTNIMIIKNCFVSVCFAVN